MHLFRYEIYSPILFKVIDSCSNYSEEIKLSVISSFYMFGVKSLQG